MQSLSDFRSDLLLHSVAIVTGGASGIGLCIAQQFLKHGAKVFLISRSAKNLSNATAALSKISPHVAGRVCDVRNQDLCREAVCYAISLWGRLDILVNGAAANFLAPLRLLRSQSLKQVLWTDVLGTFCMAKAVSETKQFKGCIINISAISQNFGSALMTHIGAAKAAVDALTRHLAVELGSFGVRVNAVAPGLIMASPGIAKLHPNRNHHQSADSIPLQYLGSMRDVARACLFLASQASQFITGQVLLVDGGQSLTAGNLTFLHQPIRKSLIGQNASL